MLDQQLQDTIFQFEHKAGVVERITDEDGAKSEKLAAALLARKPIIIVTIQTFGFVLKRIQTEEALRGRNFAVIADEAHSSQSGKAAAELKKVLGKDAVKVDDDDAEVDKSDAVKALVRWVRLHPHDIAQKVAIIVEHFRHHVAWRLNGQAKAMVAADKYQTGFDQPKLVAMYVDKRLAVGLFSRLIVHEPLEPYGMLTQPLQGAAHGALPHDHAVAR